MLMESSDTESPEWRAVASVSVLPTPSKFIDLKTIDDVRLELARVYRAMKGGDVLPQDGTRLAYVLAQIGKLIEASVVEQRVEALERALARRPK